MAATFGGVTFGAVIPGMQDANPAKVVVHEIPGGATWYVALNGQSPGRLSVDVTCASLTVYTNLRAQVGAQGTLATAEGSRTAVLLSLTRHTKVKSGHQVARAEWLLL